MAPTIFARIAGTGSYLPEKVLTNADLEQFVETSAEPRLPLRFPGGIVATEDRLYVADSGHHRILECNHAGRVLRQFGMGTADFIDGDLEQSAFRRPHGRPCSSRCT